MGLALRSWARGWSVGVVQFVKSGRWPTGEKAALLALGRLHEQTGEGAPVRWYQAGLGRAAQRRPCTHGAGDARRVAQRGWDLCKDLLGRQAHDVLVLDELTYPIRRGWIGLDDVVATLASRPGHQHVVVTGRGCPDPLLEAADLVTRMDKVRHPFDTGARGQRGIEW